jgi:hypothetical protein
MALDLLRLAHIQAASLLGERVSGNRCLTRLNSNEVPMLRRTAGMLALLALVVLTTSCRRLEQRGGPGSLPVQPVANGMVLPADWGNLISVTSSDTFPGVMQLWLQDSAGNVRVAAFSLPQNKLTYVTLIRRQGQ